MAATLFCYDFVKLVQSLLQRLFLGKLEKIIQSVAGIKKTHDTRSVPNFLRLLGLFHNRVPVLLTKMAKRMG
eukprot:2788010-Prymnesium_polylepis.1